MSPTDEYKGYEYLFADTAKFDENGSVWHFQFRAPDAAKNVSIDVMPWRNREEIYFDGVTLMDCPPIKEALSQGGVERVIPIGCLDNEISVSGRTDIPVKLSMVFKDGSSGKHILSTNLTTAASGDFNVFIPLSSCLAETIAIAVSSSTNATLGDLKTISRFHPMKVPSKNSASWFNLPLQLADSVSIEGNLVAFGTEGRTPKAALMQLDFLDARGNSLRATQTAWSEKYGNYVYLYSGNAVSNGNFKTMISIPAGARTLRIGFSKWALTNSQMLSGLKANFHVAKFALPDYLRNLKASGLTEEAVNRFLVDELGQNWHEALKSLSVFPKYKASQFQGFILRRDVYSSDGVFRLKGYKDFDVSAGVDWMANPYNSATWLLKYDSGFWIPFAAPNGDDIRRLEWCKTAWGGFWEKNAFYPSAANNMVFVDHVLAARIEGILVLMFGLHDDINLGKQIPSAWSGLIRDNWFLSRLMYQLCVDARIVDEYLRSQRLGVHNHNLIMAKALLIFADSFPMFEVSARYKEVALRTINGHFAALYEADGFIREQSSAYHHAFIQYFLDFYAYFREHKVVDDVGLRDMEALVAKILSVDAVTCFPDEGQVVPIGDTGKALQRNELRGSVEKFRALGGAAEIPVEFSSMPPMTILPRSGIYVFRNVEEKRMLVVDISNNKAAHGHYDCGSFHYFADGVRWIMDRGGPYKYASPEHRTLMSSKSHSVAMPSRQDQKAGVAYDVQLNEDEAGWVLSFRTNVYGPKYAHRRVFRIDKQLSSICVEDEFRGAVGDIFDNRIVFGPDVSLEIADSGCVASTTNGDANLFVETDKPIVIEDSNASYATHTFVPVKVLRATGNGDANGLFKSSINLRLRKSVSKE